MSKRLSMAEIEQKLIAMLQLKDGWDSYKGKAPTLISVCNAFRFIQKMEWADFLTERVVPSICGGVDVAIDSGNRNMILEFYNKGNDYGIFWDDREKDFEDEDTHAFPITYENAEEIINRAKLYMDEKK